MHRFTLGMMVVAMGFVAGCGDKQAGSPQSDGDAGKTASEAVTTEDVRQESAEAMATVGKLAARTRDEYVDQMRSDMEAIGQRLDKLKTKAEASGRQAGEAWNDRMERLAAKRQALQDNVAEVADATGDAWRELAQGAGEARKELAEALRKAEAEFKTQADGDASDAPSDEEGLYAMSQEFTLSKDMGQANATEKGLRVLLNKEGISLSDLRPAGVAEIEGRRVDVVAQGTMIAEGNRVRVTKVEGNRVVVEGVA